MEDDARAGVAGCVVREEGPWVVKGRCGEVGTRVDTCWVSEDMWAMEDMVDSRMVVGGEEGVVRKGGGGRVVVEIAIGCEELSAAWGFVVGRGVGAAVTAWVGATGTGDTVVVAGDTAVDGEAEGCFAGEGTAVGAAECVDSRANSVVGDGGGDVRREDGIGREALVEGDGDGASVIVDSEGTITLMTSQFEPENNVGHEQKYPFGCEALIEHTPLPEQMWAFSQTEILQRVPKNPKSQLQVDPETELAEITHEPCAQTWVPSHGFISIIFP